MCEQQKDAKCKQCDRARKALKQKTEIISDLERRLALAEKRASDAAKVAVQR